MQLVPEKKRILLYQIVGTGRTVTMLAAALELRKAGTFRKVLLLVEQKAILHQFQYVGMQNFPELDFTEGAMQIRSGSAS